MILGWKLCQVWILQLMEIYSFVIERCIGNNRTIYFLLFPSELENFLFF